MHKIMIICSLLVSLFSTRYATVEYIECYSNHDKKIEFIFGFKSDYLNSHEMIVTIEIFNDKDEKLISYSNNIKVVGDRESIATLDYLYLEDLYAHVSVVYNEEKILSNIRFDFYKVKDCDLNKENRNCNDRFKTVYEDNTIKDYSMDFKILTMPFDSFLSYNKLDLRNANVYSKYDISKSEIYLLIEEEIDGYNLVYDEGYKFLLGVNKNENRYNFYLLEKHYLEVEPFHFNEEYSDRTLEVNEIYFPFTSEYKEYSCKLIIVGVNTITIDFLVNTSDKLIGDCSDSKYCVERVNYD